MKNWDVMAWFCCSVYTCAVFFSMIRAYQIREEAKRDARRLRGKRRAKYARGRIERVSDEIRAREILLEIESFYEHSKKEACPLEVKKIAFGADGGLLAVSGRIAPRGGDK